MPRQTITRTLFIALVAVVTLGAAAAINVNAETTAPDTARPESGEDVLRVDIAENVTRFRFDDTFVFAEDGMPDHGSTFITQGYIYPAGTLDGTNGVLENGEPEFPDLVLGQWTCYGTFVGEGIRTASGPWVITTQVFQFGDGLSHDTIVSDGYEIADVNVPFSRAITGGSGQYAAARGEQVQEVLGFTESMAMNMRVELRLAE